MTSNLVSLGALLGDSAPSSAAPRARIVPTTNSAATQTTKIFPFQSYFDTTLLEKAVLEQAPNNPIVQSTITQQQVGGYAIGNHPDSQTPVAVIFSGDGRQSGSATHIIPPGGIVRPTSGTRGDSEDAFQSFSWGLPFGWLGGGLATIVVFPTKDSWANWRQETEVLFHRFTAQVYSPANLPAVASIANWPRNWPTRFPSLLTRRGSGAISQGGAPQISIRRPGQIVLNLHTTIGSDSKLKALFYHTTDFGDELSATPSPAPFSSVEFTVPARTPYVYPAGYTEYTLIDDLPPAMSRLGCDGKSTSTATMTAGVIFTSDDPQLQGQYIDVARYGYL